MQQYSPDPPLGHCSGSGSTYLGVVGAGGGGGGGGLVAGGGGGGRGATLFEMEIIHRFKL